MFRRTLAGPSQDPLEAMWGDARAVPQGISIDCIGSALPAS